VRADVGVRAEADALIAAALDHFGRVDVLINNAGVYTLGALQAPWEYSDADWDRLLAINLSSVFYCTRAAIPGMLERRSGAIVNVTSLGAQAVRPISVGPYSAAKAGVIGYTMSCAAWAGPHGVRVNAVSPGMIDTDIHADLSPEAVARMEAGIPLRRQGTPEETAEAILWLASDASRYLTGTVLDVNGGLHMG
jgi:3-oxoacyl-[acyl-carrier protein] reductase